MKSIVQVVSSALAAAPQILNSVRVMICLAIWFAFLAYQVGAAPIGISSSTIQWTRLVTKDKYWNRHASCDSRLTALMSDKTVMAVAQQWKNVPCEIEKLASVPFLYAADISSLSRREGSELCEYLKRGGFMLVDSCINAAINPDPQAFLKQQLSTLKEHLPAIEVEVIGAEHVVYTIYFAMDVRPPMTRNPISWSGSMDFPLRILRYKGRVVAMISLCGLQCAWDRRDEDSVPLAAMKMATNIYFFAMTR